MLFSGKSASALPFSPLGLWTAIVFLNLHNLDQGLSYSIHPTLSCLPSHRGNEDIRKIPPISLGICKVINNLPVTFTFLLAQFSVFLLCVIFSYLLNPIILVPYLRSQTNIYHGICSFCRPDYISGKKFFHNVLLLCKYW